MQINSQKAFDFLLSKGVTHLHHANTVTTSCSFIQKKELIARGCMERLGLNQTPQESDANDRAHGVYCDVFLDSVDIHERASRRNVYGPVLFKLSVEKMKAMNLPPIWITKSNPYYWDEDTTEAEKWFQSLEELEADFVKGRFNQMIVLRHVGGVLPLNDCLDEIMLDDPHIDENGFNYFSLSVGALLLARSAAPEPIKFKLLKRQCKEGCRCVKEYKDAGKDVIEYFVPSRITPQPALPAAVPPQD